MKLMTALCLTMIAALLSGGCSSSNAAAGSTDPAVVVHDNIAKAKVYHEYAAKAKVTQADLQSFVAQWVKECDLRGGWKLQMGQDGDPACTNPKDMPQPAQPAQAPATATPATAAPQNSGKVPNPVNAHN